MRFGKITGVRNFNSEVAIRVLYGNWVRSNMEVLGFFNEFLAEWFVEDDNFCLFGVNRKAPVFAVIFQLVK